MLTPDVRLEGFTAEDWQRFVSLWQPRASPEREPVRARGGVIVVHDGARVRKVLSTRHGRVDPSFAWPRPLGELAAEHEASWALAAKTGALEELMERFGARAKRSDDVVAQSLSLVNIVRELMNEGQIESWPRRLKGIPVPSENMVRRALDSVCADGNAIALGLFKDGELWTAFVARRKGMGFDVLAGPDELRPAMGLLSGDWRRDFSHLVRAIEDRYAELSLGCFAEVDVFRALQMDGRAGAWSKAVAMREVALSPIPMAVGVALGVDSTRYAFEGLRRVAPLIDPFGVMEPLMRSVRERVGNATDKDLTAILGFSPLEALRALLKRD
jgi:hypothetical protein